MTTPEKGMKKQKGLKAFVAKALLVVLIITAIIGFFEHKQLFIADNLNNHIDWRWASFNKLTKAKKSIDIIVLGNSHALTGISALELSEQLGIYSFILGSPGVSLFDLYFTLEEALRIQKPKILVLETYAINNSSPYTLSGGALNEQINSFQARSDFWLKIKSTPKLFALENYPIAWVNTLRNHNFIFRKPEQIKYSWKNDGPRKNVRNDLYLGQFGRFSSGLTEATLERYEKEGAPVDGNDFTLSNSSKKYLKLIAKKCKENNIQLVFLTIPMYHKHIKNYKHWRDELGKELYKYSTYWLDLQYNYNAEIYTLDTFEDTYSQNQHLTNKGMVVTADNLSNYLKFHFSRKQ